MPVSIKLDTNKPFIDSRDIYMNESWGEMIRYKKIPVILLSILLRTKNF